MVDVSGKAATARSATARATVRSTPEVIALIASGGLPKGDALATARVAGILAAKRTSTSSRCATRSRSAASMWTSASPIRRWN